MIMYDALVSDVLEVIAIDKSDVAAPKSYFFGLTTGNEIGQSIETEQLKAGIGDVTWAVLKGSKQMTVSAQYAAFNDYLTMLQVGSDFEVATSVNVAVKETADYEATGISITGTPVGTAVTVLNNVTGETLEGTFATGKVTTDPAVTTGTSCTVIYEKALTSQSILPFKADALPKNFELHLHGIAKQDGVVVADIYYVFYNASLSGNFTKSFQNGAPDGEGAEFDIAARKGTTDYGFYTAVARA